MNEKYQQIKDIVDKQGSRIFAVKFIKKDGTERTMLVQNAATRTHTKGEAAAPTAQKAAQTRKINHPNLLNVYDIQKHGIRSINMDTLLKIAGQGKTLWTRSRFYNEDNL